MSISTGRRVGILAVAVAATASPILAFTNSAEALSADGKRLCEQRCSISVAGTGNTNSVDEGTSVKVNVTGKPGSYKLQVFRIVPDTKDKSGKKFTLKAAGPAAAIKVGSSLTETKVKIDPIKSPLTARKDAYTVQLTDAGKDTKELVGNGGTRINQFSVNSHRGAVAGTAGTFTDGDGNGEIEVRPGSLPNARISYGLPGDRYAVDVKTPSGRKRVSTTDDPKNGVVKADHTALVFYDLLGLKLPEGRYDVLIYNVKDPANPVNTGYFRVGGRPPAPTGSASPSASATPSRPATPTRSASPTRTRTASPSTTATRTRTATPTKTKTPTKSQTPTKTMTPTTVPTRTSTPTMVVDPPRTPTTTTPPATPTTPPTTPADPTTPATPNDEPVDNRIASVFLASDGAGGPKYRVTGNVLTSWGRLADANGQPIGNATVIVRAVRGGQNGEELGRTTTAADGSFNFDATLPADHNDDNFAAAMIFDGDAEHKPASLTTNPKASAPNGDDPVAPSDGGGTGGDTSDTAGTSGGETSVSDDAGTVPVSVPAPTRLPSTGASDLVVPGVLGALALAGGCVLLLTRRRA